FGVDDRDVVAPASIVGGGNQRLHDGFPSSGVPTYEALDRRGRDHVGQAIRTEQYCGVPLEYILHHLDVVVFVLVAQRAADVAEDFMATRVSHRVDFGDLLRILPLAHGRVIVRQLPHALGAQLVETAVAHVPDRQAPVVD